MTPFLSPLHAHLKRLSAPPLPSTLTCSASTLSLGLWSGTASPPCPSASTVTLGPSFPSFPFPSLPFASPPPPFSPLSRSGVFFPGAFPMPVPCPTVPLGVAAGNHARIGSVVAQPAA